MQDAENKMLEKLAGFLKIVGDTNRLRIIWVIGKGERPVSEIINETGLSQTLVSFHLKVLREAEIVETERRGVFIYYRLGNPGLIDLLSACGEYAHKLTGEITPGFTWPCPPWFNK
ncbi:MAG: transcriptional regulator [Firmicutes bacterium HGW-Firmicutes-14]|nr:MAG: transcriptional regulator [Firmicutes bacterium HGW-Firmicutes-14]